MVRIQASKIFSKVITLTLKIFLKVGVNKSCCEFCFRTVHR